MVVIIKGSYYELAFASNIGLAIQHCPSATSPSFIPIFHSVIKSIVVAFIILNLTTWTGCKTDKIRCWSKLNKVWLKLMLASCTFIVSLMVMIMYSLFNPTIFCYNVSFTFFALFLATPPSFISISHSVIMIVAVTILILYWTTFCKTDKKWSKFTNHLKFKFWCRMIMFIEMLNYEIFFCLGFNISIASKLLTFITPPSSSLISIDASEWINVAFFIFYGIGSPRLNYCERL